MLTPGLSRGYIGENIQQVNTTTVSVSGSARREGTAVLVQTPLVRSRLSNIGGGTDGACTGSGSSGGDSGGGSTTVAGNAAAQARHR